MGESVRGDVGEAPKKALLAGGVVTFLKDCRRAVLYSSKAVIARFVKAYILRSNVVRQHRQPMTGESRSERQRRFYYGEDDRREALARTLKAAGVEYIFGIAVGSQAPLTLAAMRLGMRIVTVRDEKCAALMATAYSKISGKPGICLASSPGPHLALGMYEAFNASNAIVALTADASVAGMWRPGSAYMDQQAVFQPITKWTVRAEALATLPNIIRRALESQRRAILDRWR